MSLIQGTGGGLGGAGAPGGALAGGAVFSHTINQSLRFEEGRACYLSFTPNQTETDNKKFTYSVWIKRGQESADDQHLIQSKNTGSGTGQGHVGLLIDDSSKPASLDVYSDNGAGIAQGTRVLRDHTAWYNIVFRYDTTQPDSPDRIRIYVNGVLDERSGTPYIPGVNTVISSMNVNGQAQRIGSYVPGFSRYFNGYMAEIHMVDGQSLDPSNFGETVGGVWVPKKYDDNGTTSHGANGYHLTFEGTGTATTTDGTTAQTNIGDDQSGNGNNWAVNGLLSSDVVLDSPTNNFCILNELTRGTWPTLDNGALSIAGVYSADLCGVTATWFPTTGKWYWEVHNEGAASTYPYLGITDQKRVLINSTKGSFYSVAWLRTGTAAAASSANTYMGTITKNNVTSWTNNDIIMFALDVDARKLWIGKNGTWDSGGDPAAGSGEDASWTEDTGVSPCFMGYSSQGLDSTFNFGQDGTFNGHQTAQGNADGNGVGNFYYSPPSGFLAMATSNLTDPTIGPGQDTQADDHFETMLYTGNGDEQHIGANGVQFPVDTVTIGQSLRFEDNHHFDRTATAGNQSTWTFSAWIKRAELGTVQYIWTPHVGGDGSNESAFRFTADDTINIYDSGATRGQVTTTRKFKDVSSWMHLVVVLDLTDSTAADRVKIYVNGELQDKTINNAIGTSVWGWNANGQNHRLGGYALNTTSNLVGYMAEVNFIDGTALDPTYFGQVGANGYWIPKTISGLTYGANGFRMTFQNSSYLNYDYQTSDRSTTNDFNSPTGLAATDLVTDSPTQNFTVLDSNYINSQTQTFAAGNLDFSSSQTSTNPAAVSAFAVNTGKWYWEVLIRADAGSTSIGIASKPNVLQSDPYALYVDDDAYQYMTDGTLRNGSFTSSYGDAWTTGDIIGVALDLDAGAVYFYKNGTIQNSGTAAFTGLSSTEGFTSYGLAYQDGAHTYNFGQDDGFSGNKTGGAAASDDNSVGAFYYTPPSGYLALMNDNISKAGIESPDFVWIKQRSAPDADHYLFDTVRGATKNLHLTAAIEATDADSLLSFNNEGFTVGSKSDVNGADETYVAWTWKAGGIAPTQTYAVTVVEDGGQKYYRFDGNSTNALTLNLQEGGTYTFDQSDSTNALGGAAHPLRFSTTSDGTHGGGSQYTTGVTTTGTAGQAGAKTVITVAHGAPTLYYYCSSHSGMGGQANTTTLHGSSNFKGTIPAIVSANPTAGFSIIRWTNNGTAGTVGHGLTSTPELITVKNMDYSLANWYTWTKFTTNDKVLFLNAANAETASANAFTEGSMTATTIGVGTERVTNGSGSGEDLLAYAFHSVDGFSKVGRYYGNGNANGVFVHTGFRPSWVLYKNSTSANGWFLLDTIRDDRDFIQNTFLRPSTDDDEDTAANSKADFLSNGFKLRGNGGDVNTLNNTYVYLAFADAPFKFANAL
jgi:hypothetical protein